MNIYLDIDGVLVGKQHQPVEGAVEFLERVTSGHKCFWLTTHCRDGRVDRAVEVLSKVYGEKIIPIAQKVQPATWQTFKTEAINFLEDFRWVDDYVMLYEEAVLKKENALEKLILIDLHKQPRALRELHI